MLLEPVDWSERRSTPAGVRGRGDPAGAERAEEAPRHARGKRSACSGNQQPNLTQPFIKSIKTQLAKIGSPCYNVNSVFLVFGACF
jgi:hypothetical protein